MRQLIDDFLPAPDWSERHEKLIDAPPLRVDELLRALRPRDMPIARVLFAIRMAFSPTKPDPDVTFEDAMRALGFGVLADVPGEELVMGIGGRFWDPRADALDPIAGPEEFLAYDRPNSVKVALNFGVRPVGVGTRLTLETRIKATDARARRTFGRYWRLVMPGSALIRRETLWVVARRARRGA